MGSLRRLSSPSSVPRSPANRPRYRSSNSRSCRRARRSRCCSAGRRAAQTDEARAREVELLAAYRGAAINAFSEVETALGAIANLSEQQGYQIEQVAQSEQAFNIAETRYREGVDDFLHVLDAQRQLYSARDQLGITKLQRLQAIVALYKALGGSWQDPAANLAQK